MTEAPRIQIWFFIGLLLSAYGLLVTGAGLWELIVPPRTPRALAELHPSLWWGLILLAFGSFYVWRFYPRRR